MIGFLFRVSRRIMDTIGIDPLFFGHFVWVHVLYQRFHCSFLNFLGKTFSNILQQGRTVEDLITLFEQLNPRKGNRLIEKLERTMCLSKAFLTLLHFWSFIDYNLLGHVLEKFCSHLKPCLDEYVASINAYGKRRVCEVPNYSYHLELSESKERRCLCFQMDKIDIERITLNDLKSLSHQLGELLETSLRLLKIDSQDNCVEITFNCYHESEGVFQLSKEQDEGLR